VSVKVGDSTFNLENLAIDEIQRLFAETQKPELPAKTEIVIHSSGEG